MTKYEIAYHAAEQQVLRHFVRNDRGLEIAYHAAALRVLRHFVRNDRGLEIASLRSQ